MYAKQNGIGIGLAQDHNPSKCGREAARMALDGMMSSPSWALVFSGGRHNPDAIINSLRSELGEVDILGGSCVGAITNRSIEYTGFECAVAVFPSRISKPVILTVSDLNRGEAEAGRELGQKLSQTMDGDRNVLLFYDSVRSGGAPPVLNTASRFLDGIYEGLSGKNPRIIGAGLVGDFQLSKSYVFDGRQSVRQCAVAAVLPDTLSIHYTIMHGCIPVSSFLEVTKIEGPVVYEINHRPAIEVLREVTGKTFNDEKEENLSLTVTLGEKHGDPYAPYDESAYVNRLIVATNPQDGSVVLFEADFQVGTKVQIMARNNELMLESVKNRTNELLKSMNSSEPTCAFYVDCAGRSSAFSGSETEEASILQAALGPNIPLLGFYSGVEIAPFRGRSRPLDWTGVLTFFTLENR